MFKNKLFTPALVAGALMATVFNTSFAADSHKLKLSHYQPVDSATGRLAEAFAKEIEIKTDGRVTFTLYPANQLGDWMEVSEQIMRGTVDIGIQPVSPTYDPRLQVRVLPYAVIDWDDAKKAYIGDSPYLFDIMAIAMDDVGLKALGVQAQGFGGGGFAVYNKDIDLVDPDSNKGGIKMRFPPGNQAWEAMVDSMGFLPTPVPWGELYIGMQTGLVDSHVGGQPYNTWSTFKDVTKVWVQYNTHFQNSFIFMNKKKWNKLSKSDQKILLDVSKKYSEESFQSAFSEDQSFMDKMKEIGIKIIIPTREEYKKLANKARTKVWKEMESVIGKDIIDEIRAKSTK